mgnify:CR=1 FL=1
MKGIVMFGKFFDNTKINVHVRAVALEALVVAVAVVAVLIPDAVVYYLTRDQILFCFELTITK